MCSILHSLQCCWYRFPLSFPPSMITSLGVPIQNWRVLSLLFDLWSVICGGSVSENVTVGHKVPQMTSYSHNQSRTLESKRSQSSWRAFCILYHWFWYALLPPLSRNMIVKISWLFYYSPKQTYAKLKMTNLWSSLTVSFDLFSRTPNSQLS
jgi:hypothetical protein